jgi:hypothetical protein
MPARKPAFELVPHHRHQGFRVVAYPLKRMLRSPLPPSSPRKR